MKPLTASILSIFVFLSLISHAQPADTTEWTAMLGADKVGFTKLWNNSDGSYSELFKYNDRGRGDSTVTTYRYDNQGYFTSINASGVDYFKKPVFEKYTMADGIASWENNSEKEQKKVAGKADYVPLKISCGFSYQSYFNTPDQTIQLVPTGTSTLKILKTHKLPTGEEVTLVSTFGMGFTPNYSWIDKDHRFFAYVSDWFSQIRKGYEDNYDALNKIVKGFQESYFKELAVALRENYKTGVAVINANVFDPKTGKKTPKSTILISKGTIDQVSTGKVKIPKGYKVIDAQNKFVMPGLWDMHVHYSDAMQGLLHLSCGVTNARDLGNGLSLLDQIKDINNGTVLGPRIQRISGFIDGAGPFAGPVGEKIHSVDEGKIAIKKYADLGYHQIKLYSSIKPEWVKPLVDEAKKYNMRVSGHIPAHMIAEEAVKAGYDEIQHANMLFLNFYEKELDTRTPVRFTSVAERAVDFDFESDRFKGFVQLLKSNNIVLDPTVTAFEGMFTGEEGKPDPSFVSTLDRFPLSMQRNLKSSGSLNANGKEETFRKSYLNMLKMVKVMHDNGITIVPGTDGFAGFTLHRELVNYERAGIAREEILKMATITSAEVAGLADKFGTIEKGKAADIIIVDGDPTRNMEDIRRVETVIKDMDIYQSKDIVEKLSIKYFK